MRLQQTQTSSLTEERERLALCPAEAARALGVSARTLWSWTKQNLVPHVRIGRKILYPVDDLKQWMTRNIRVANAEAAR